MKKGGDKSGMTCGNIHYRIHAYVQVISHDRLITAHAWWPHRGLDSRDVLSLHTSNTWLVPVSCMGLYVRVLPHSSFSPPNDHTHARTHARTHTKFQPTHAFSVFQPSLYIVPEAATRYTEHYKLQTSPPHPSMCLPAIQLITC